MRIGFGYDSHRFEEAAGKPLVLGGVVFEGETGLKAHSDGDVVIHAVIDALLGAAALGDIGSHFPDTDERWRGVDSMTLLEAVADEIGAAGYRFGNLDVTIICERPKILPRVAEMKRRIGEAINDRMKECSNVRENECSNDRMVEARISIKGKTNEKMDDVGAGKGIEVHAVCLLEER